MKHFVAGRRFGKLVALSDERDARSRVPCKCDCGKQCLVKASHLVSGRQVSCGCYRHEWQAVTTLNQLLAMCSKQGPDECWPWKGALGSHGYGRVNFQGVHMTASRAVFSAVHGRVPDGLLVCHKCDNPPCVNPEHLFVGTYQDNVTDMMQKGRGRWVTRSEKRTYCRKGHLLAATEYIVPSTGSRLCGVCMRARQNTWRRNADTASGEQK